MREALEGQVLGVLRRAMLALLALGLLGALAPSAIALALPGATSTACEGPGAACSMQDCQQPSPLARDVARTPGSTAVISEGWRERVLPSPETWTAWPAAPPIAGPPAYLRFQRLLL